MSGNKRVSLSKRFNKAVGVSLASVFLMLGATGCTTTNKYPSTGHLSNPDLINKAQNEVYEGHKAGCEAAFTKEYETLKAKWQRAHAGSNISEFNIVKKRYEQCLKAAGLPDQVNNNHVNPRDGYYLNNTRRGDNGFFTGDSRTITSGTSGRYTTKMTKNGPFTIRTTTYNRNPNTRNGVRNNHQISLFGGN